MLFVHLEAASTTFPSVLQFFWIPFEFNETFTNSLLSN